MSLSVFEYVCMCMLTHAYFVCVRTCMHLNLIETGQGLSSLPLLYSPWCQVVIIQWGVIVEDAA